MAELISKDKYRGSIGEMTYYELNGKLIVRKKRRKLSKTEKRKTSIQNGQRNRVQLGQASQLAKAMRRGVDYKGYCNHLYIGKMNGFVYRLIEKDKNNRRGEKELVAGSLADLKEFVPNPEFNKDVESALKAAGIHVITQGVYVNIPQLNLHQIEGDRFRLWAVLNKLDLKARRSIGIERAQLYVEQGHHSQVKLFLTPSDISNGDSLSIALGIETYKNGHRQDGLDKNGFVFLGSTISKVFEKK